MGRNATLSLEGLDPDVLDAARDIARRAGMPLEAWIESVTATERRSDGRRRRRASASEAAPTPAPGASAPTAPEPGSQAQASQRDAAAPAPDAERTDALGASIEAMMRRLDALDRSIAEDRKASSDAATRAVETLGARIAAVLDGGGAPVGDMAERLADIERRIGELNAHLSGPRPLGRRGRPLVAEVRDAVEEVRQRQRELEESGEDARGPSPAIAELQAETSRLRESLDSLATGRDVGALEQAMRALVTDVQQAREPSDLAAIAAPIELMRVQVERLADEIAANVHARVSGEVERLASKVDGALSAAPASFADRDALDDVFRELDDIRRQIAALAAPERIQMLGQGLQAISHQIAQLQNGVAADRPGVAELKPLLEEIRSGLKAPDASKAILGRIDALADKMDRVNVSPVGELIGRLESLGETLRRPQMQDSDLAAIQRMLRGLAEKVDRIASGPDAEGLDAIEKQVVALSRRLDARGADPALGNLERMMGDLLKQVSASRNDGAIEAAVERAARKAVADAAGSDRAAGTGGIDLLRADLADLCAQQAAADQRMQATMANLNTALERLVERLGPTGPSDSAGQAARAETGPSIADRLRAATLPLPPAAAMLAARNGVARRQDPPEALPEAARPGEELLEPGAGRPVPGAVAAPPEPAAASAGADIKSSFIAAARRAAQAAQADLDAPTTPETRSERPRLRRPAVGTADTLASPGLVGRLRGAIEKRRRLLLLGLAAVVLTLGALQVFETGDAGSTADAPVEPAVAAKAPATDEAKPAEDAKVATAPLAEPTPEPSAAPPTASERPPAVDPQTTQAILQAPAPEIKAPMPPESGGSPAPAGKPSIMVPKVASMASLKGDLATVPASLAALRQAALDGDGAAIFELATRAADGRGMPRDLALAAKLYEKLAAAGYAPAQFKLASFYEKGSGVIRDLGQAKHWYGRAADLGNVRAMHNLAVLHAENPAANGKPDFAAAASWFRRAAEYGMRDSQYNLAVLCARGLGLNQDLVQSYAWFSAAAAQGDDEAGKKRDDVAAKLAPKDLAVAKSMAAAFKPKLADAAANDIPAPKAVGSAPMTLLGAPPPGSPPATGFAPVNRRPDQTGA